MIKVRTTNIKNDLSIALSKKNYKFINYKKNSQDHIWHLNFDKHASHHQQQKNPNLYLHIKNIQDVHDEFGRIEYKQELHICTYHVQSRCCFTAKNIRNKFKLCLEQSTPKYTPTRALVNKKTYLL